jgi:hypothetical protein
MGQEIKVATNTALIAPRTHQERTLTQAGERSNGFEID